MTKTKTKIFKFTVSIFILFVTTLFANNPQLDSLRDMIQLGDSLKIHAQFDSAITVFNHVFIEAEKHNDEASMIYAHLHLSETYGNLADFTTAETHANQALHFSSLFENDSLWIESKKSILTLYYQQGEYQKALDIAEDVLNKRIILWGANHFDVAMDYNDIGVLSFMLGDYSKATDAYSRAFEIIRNEESHLDLRAQLLNNMGVAYARQGNYLDALDHYSRSLELKKQYMDSDHPSLGTNLRNIGMIYSRIGEYHHGLEYYQQALDNWKHYYGEAHPKVGELYQDISVAKMYLGDYQSALQLQLEGLDILKTKLDASHPKISAGNSNLSMIYMGLEMYDEAEEHNRKSVLQQIERYGDEYPHLAINYSNLGTVFSETGRFDSAKVYFDKALHLRISQYGEDHYRTAIIYGKIGSMYFHSKDYPSAEINMKKALSIAKEFWEEYHHRTGEFYVRLGRLYSKLNDHETALQYYQKNVICQSVDFTDTSFYANPELTPNPKNYQLLNALADKANEMTLLAQTDQFSYEEQTILNEKTLSTFEYTVELLNTIRKGFYLDASKLKLSELHASIFSSAIHLAHSLYEKTNDSNYLERAFLLSEQERAMVFWENLQTINARQFSGISDSLIQLEKNLRTEIAFHQNTLSKLKSTAGDTIRRSLKARLFNSTENYKTLLSSLDENYPDYYALKFNAPLTDIQNIQSSLDRKTALLEYSISDTVLYIFGLTQKDFYCETVPIDSSFSDLIRRYRRSIIKLNTSDYAETGFQLYKLLIDPIKPHIRFKKKLVIIPHDILHELPFDALLTKASPKKKAVTFPYLIRQYDIALHYSANLYQYTQQIPNGRAEYQFAGFAPAVFQQNTVNLPKSVDEILSIQSLFDDRDNTTTTRLYRDADERHLKSDDMKTYRYIHLATHGVISQDDSNQSYLVFSDPDSTDMGEDNILYANECFGLDLQSDLVVLSSCESGIGDIAKGEGMMGLNRGFQYSGTKNIVYSLWKVDDRSSERLMPEMYRHITRTGVESSALRKAKLAMIKHPETAFPKAWAGYVWMGE